MVKQFLDENLIPYKKDVSLKSKTWIKTGGIAKYWIVPEEIEQLSIITKFLSENNKHFDVVGHTSNIYFLNNYNPECVISTAKLSKFKETKDSIICECGVSISRLSQEMVKKGVLGFYGLVNLPGTVAAAIHNNAGCFNCSVSERLISIQFISAPDSKLLTLSSEDLKFTHRSSAIKRKELNGIILSIELKKEVGNPDEEINKATIATIKRKATQELPTKNLGSIYTGLVYQKKIRNIIAGGIKMISRHFHIGNNGMLYYKKLQLFFYGFRYLDSYISDKNINTFIWKDEKATEMFEFYQLFMNKVYINPILEIELKK